MRKVIYLIIILFPTLSIFSQECGECSVPHIALYDFDVKVEKPQTDEEILNWMNLFWTGLKAKVKIRENEPNKDCISWYDGAMINANMLQNGTLKFGNEYTNLPPEGALNSVDYILSGYVQESGSNTYEGVLTLETSVSREIVKSVSTTFINSLTEASNAGEELANKFGSILDVIRNFEKYKRDNDNTVAIRDISYLGMEDKIRVEPTKKNVTAGESVDVKFTLIDCDGVALSGRTIYLSDFVFEGEQFDGPTNGKFDKDQIVTDADGKASAKFTPNLPGLAVLRVTFPHYKPTGAWDAFIGVAYLNVPPETYEIKAINSFNFTMEGDTNYTKTDQNGSLNFTSFTRQSERMQFTFSGLIGRDYSIPVVKSYSKVLSMIVTGKYKNQYNFYKNLTFSTNGITGKQVEKEQEILYGSPTKDERDIYAIDYNNGSYPEVNILTSYSRKGQHKDEYYGNDNGWSIDSYNIDENSVTQLVTNESVDVTEIGDKSFLYKAEYNTETHDTDAIQDFHGHTLNSYETETWEAILKPYDETTGFFNDEEKNDIDFYLGQNYPNPFNPTTKIIFTISSGSNTKNVSLKVYDALGQEIKELVNGVMSGGNYEIEFDGKNLPTGIYFYVMKVGNYSSIKKMMLLK